MDIVIRGKSVISDRLMSDNNDDIWLATDLPIGATTVTETTWGRTKATFR